jgi:F-type H+-transporting ATPase subunit b
MANLQPNTPANADPVAPPASAVPAAPAAVAADPAVGATVPSAESVVGSAPVASEELHATTQAEPHAGGNPLLRLDPGVSVWTLVTFAALILLLKSKVWGPILASLDERDKVLRTSMESAEKARHEARKISEEQEATLNTARGEARKIVEEARKIGDDLRTKLTTEANEERHKIVESAGAEIEAMKETALRDLRSTVATLAVEVSARLLKEKMDEQHAKNLTDRLIEELEVSA